MRLQDFANKKPYELTLKDLLSKLPEWGLQTSPMDGNHCPDKITICVSSFKNNGARCYITLHLKKELLQTENLGELVNVFYLAGQQQYDLILNYVSCYDIEASGFKGNTPHTYIAEYKCVP